MSFDVIKFANDLVRNSDFNILTMQALDVKIVNLEGYGCRLTLSHDIALHNIAITITAKSEDGRASLVFKIENVKDITVSKIKEYTKNLKEVLRFIQ